MHIIFKSKTRSKTYFHMLNSSGPCLPTREGSGVAMCLAASDRASLLGRASVPPHAPRHRTLPPYSGGRRCCHVPHRFGPCLPAREGSDAATYPTALNGPRASGIKKGLAGLSMQLGSHVSKSCSHVTEVHVRCVGSRCHLDLQTMQISATVPRQRS
jgi:hypothetical protein